MNPRKACVLTTLTLGVVVVAALLAPAWLWAARLPDPVAIHWSLTGRPNGHAGLALVTGLVLAAWIGIAALTTAAAGTSDVRRRGTREVMLTALGATAGTLISSTWITVLANRDQRRWDEARLDTGRCLAVVAVCTILLAVLGRTIGRIGPDQPDAGPPGALSVETVPPGEGQILIWVSGAHNRAFQLLAVACIAASVTLAAPVISWLPTSDRVLYAGGAFFLGLIFLFCSTLRVSIRDDVLTAELSPLRWPRRTIQLRPLVRAWRSNHSALSFGGWGLRGVPGSSRSAMIVRGGECLNIEYGKDRTFVVSVDDADTGAAVINAAHGSAGTDRSR